MNCRTYLPCAYNRQYIFEVIAKPGEDFQETNGREPKSWGQAMNRRGISPVRLERVGVRIAMGSRVGMRLHFAVRAGYCRDRRVRTLPLSPIVCAGQISLAALQPKQSGRLR